MKKTLIGLIALLLFITGCNPNKEYSLKSDNYNIEKIAVTYTKPDNTNVKISVDLINDVKCVTEYTDNTHITSNYGLVNKTDLNRFLKEDVVPEMLDSEYKDSRVGTTIWSIKVTTNNETICVKGGYDDKLPDFGENLINLL